METAFLSTYILLGVIVIVSIKGFNDRDFMEKYLYSPYLVKHYNQWYRMFTHAFLHGDATHLIFNAITLFLFGQNLEKILTEYTPHGKNGMIIYWVLVLGSMVFSTLISYARHKDNQYYRSLGFSGVTSAMVYGFIILAPTAQMSVLLIPIDIPAWIFGILYLAFEIYADRNKKTNIAHDAHIAGAIFGVVFIFLTNIDYVILQFNTLFS